MNTKPLILIAEDDPDDQYLFQEAIEIISPLEAETYFVWDGSTLLNYVRQMETDSARKMMIVLDLNMEVKSGQTTLEELKADPSLAQIPVVILTTSSNEADKEYCLQHGAVAYYRKPESMRELVNIVRSLYRDYLN
jgi:CheY-like chemotaxis protein